MRPEYRLSHYDFELPEALIATSPAAQREAARLLHVDGERLWDRTIRDLPSLVRPGDVWVVNNTRVIPARLLGHKPSGGRVELLLLERQREGDGLWTAWGKAGKPLRPGVRVDIASGFHAEIVRKEGKLLYVRLFAEDVMQAIERHGHMPLPPYIRRPDDEGDRQRYQTVFARHRGAIAAPTAGLHLTHALMSAMRKAGASFAEVTLHVGPGTFQPVEVEDVRRHRMHEEFWRIEDAAASAIERARAQGGRVVAVGTTSLRCLESAADAMGALRAGDGRSDLFIYPGYRFRVVDALLTNFHLPRSTLLMLVSALAGCQRVRRAYAHAIAQGYRFYSYGDAMFCSRVDDGTGG